MKHLEEAPKPFPYANYQPLRLEEDQVTRMLIDTINAPDRGSNLREFAGALYQPFRDHETPRYTGLYVAERLLRRELGLPEPDRQPGDIDLLLIPHDADAIYFDRAATYEVKVVRPTRAKPGKRPNRFGTTQLLGYVEDGFPFVSALHVIMTEPLRAGEAVQIKRMLLGANLDPVPDDAPPVEAFDWVSLDPFPFWASDNHMRRLLACDIPKYVGLNILCLNQDREGGLISSGGREHYSFAGCTWNPHRRKETVALIRAHFETTPGRYTHIPIVPWPEDGRGARFRKELPEFVAPSDLDSDEDGAAAGEPHALSTATPYRVQDLHPGDTLAFITDTVYDEPGLFTIESCGHGMDDGTSKAFKHGGYLLVRDLGVPAFEAVPMFVPIVTIRMRDGKPFIFSGVITKRHAPSKMFRYSFYNPNEEEVWLWHSSIMQVMEVIRYVPPEDIYFREGNA